MSKNRGIVVDVTSTSARPININSTIPIALVLTSDNVSGIHVFDTVDDALSDSTIKGSLGGGLLSYLKFASRKWTLNVPLVLSVAGTGEGVKGNIINAITALSSVPSVYGIRPDVIGSEGSDDHDIANALITTCEKLKARCFIDLSAEDNASAVQKRNLFGSERATPVFTNLYDYDQDTNVNEQYCASVVLALLRASVDGSKDIGYSYSVSNQVLNVSNPVIHREFLAGMQDETDLLTDNQITSFIRYKGLRTWNYKTCSTDAIWQDARRVRIFDMASFAVLDGIFFAVDKDLSALDSAKNSLRSFMADLVGAEVMLGFTIELDLKRTTPTAITANKFYFIIHAQETPSPEYISVTFDRVDSYASVVYQRFQN